MIGWMNNWQYAAKVPTMPWRGQMTIPRELSLQTFPEGIRLVQKPLTALQSLRSAHPLGIPGTVTETVDPGGATRSGWKLVSGDGYTEIGYDSLRKEIYVDRSHSGDVSFSKEFPTRTAAPFIAAGPITFDIVLDRDSLEVFAAGGRIAITNLIFPHGPVRMEPFSDGPAKFLRTDSWSLRSIW
jgi:sucrose-6-phosphate hydrolase SacC (GH32 family)